MCYTDYIDIRQEFTALEQLVGTRGSKLVYLDSAATSLKPRVVIDAVTNFYKSEGGAAGRGTNSMAISAANKCDATREKVLKFASANYANYNCVFTPGATYSINMLSLGILLNPDIFNISANSNIVLSKAEHHANIIPWQIVSAATGAKLKYIELLPNGSLDINSASKVIDQNTAIVSVTHCSNVTGIVTQLSPIIKLAKSVNALTIVDSSQAVAHFPLNIDYLDVDACVFSGHKMYAPNGVGVIIAKHALLDRLPVAITGGGIVELVTEDDTTFLPSPQKFETGSVDTAAIIGLGKAIDFMSQISWDNIITHEKDLKNVLSSITFNKDIEVLGSGDLENLENVGIARLAINKNEPPKRLALASFAFNSVHPHDLGQFLDEAGIVVRTGHHCAQLTHRAFNKPSSTRVSCGIYNTPSEIYTLLDALGKVKRFFG